MKFHSIPRIESSSPFFDELFETNLLYKEVVSFLSSAVSFSRATWSSFEFDVQQSLVCASVGLSSLTAISLPSERTSVTRDRRSASEWNASAQILNRTRCHGASSIVAPDHQETLLGIRGLTFVRDTGNGSMHERHHLPFVPSRQQYIRYGVYTLWYRIS